MNLLLLSNSTTWGRGFLDHAAEEIVRFLSPRRRVLFVPFAIHDQAAYAEKVGGRLADLGFEVDRATADGQGIRAVERAEAIFVGGGNTFRLLDGLLRSGLAEAIMQRVAAGMPYLGASAGTGVTSPTLKTTNDMPIVRPPSFGALGLVPFQFNCHYLDPDPSSRHMGETRELRIREFHEENEYPVLGLREGTWVLRRGSQLTLGGEPGARLFRRGAEPEEFLPGADLSFLLGGVA